jgi:16S rRNA (cytosine1402-N4)-methyltransferase
MHIATRTWQALRWGVNKMGESLDKFLSEAPGLLRPNGRCGVIAFHSAEDRKIKFAFRELAQSARYELVTKKPVTASAEEVAANVGARSAKLRVLAATAAGGES